MESAVRCPACKARIAPRSKPITACPECGARLKKSAAKEVTDDDRLGRAKTRRRKKRPGPNWLLIGGIGGGVVVVGVVAWITVRAIQDMRPPAVAFNRPAPAEPGGPGGPVLPPPPPGPTWNAKVDPPKNVVRPKDSLAINIVGEPHFASGHSPFVADLVPVVAGTPNPPVVSVYDIRTGEKTLTAKAMQYAQGTTREDASFFVALGPEGKTLAAKVTTPGQGKRAQPTSAVHVYRLGQEKEIARLPILNHLSWMEFGRDDDQLIAVCVPPGMGFSATAFDLKDPEKPINLEISRTPIRWRNSFGLREALAISPGRNYLAVGEGRLVELIQLSDGKVAGTCSLPGDCISVAFTADGKELMVHSQTAPERQGARVPKQFQWTTFSLADGKQLSQEQVTGGHFPGPLLAAGPKPGLAIHVDRDRLTVTDTRLSAPVYSAPFDAVRYFEKDQVLGYDARNKQIKLQTIDADQVAAGEKMLAEIFGPRPKPESANRDDAVKQPEPAAGPVPIDAVNGNVPALVDSHKIEGGAEFLMPWPGGSILSALIVKRVETPRDRYVLQWQRVDLKTGNGESPVELWPSMLPPGQVPPPAGHGAVLADHTSDGSRLAVRDAANNARIDIWDSSGKRLHGFLPYGEEIAVDALAWTGNNRLITISGNKVTGWEVPGLKAVFEVSGPYSGAFAISPGRKWIALQTDKFIDVYDTATGKPLSRMVHGNSTKKPWQAFAVSRDGTQLAATELARAPYNEMPGVWSYATWDLKTGLMKQADRLFAGHAPVRGSHLMWIGPRLLLAGGSSVIDLDSRAVIASLTLNPLQPIASPDGRYWGAHAHQPDPARPVARPVESIAATKLDDTVQALQRPAPADIVFRENSTVEVVSNTGNGTRDAVIRSQLNGLVVSEGYRGDRGGWRLAVSGQRVNTSGSLETEKGGRITIPGISGKIQLFDPTGAMVWETTASGGWDMFHTKYKGRTERVGGVGPGSGTITHYEFGGRDAGDAMAEEAWDNFVDGIKTSARFPRVLARVNGKVVPLPIVVGAGK